MEVQIIMNKNYSEVIIKDTVDIPVEQEQENIPVLGEEQETVKIRKRRTRAEIEAGLSLDEINGIKSKEESLQEEQQLKESVDKVVSSMQQQLGMSGNINGMISQQQLNEWKLRYGDLYRTYLNGQNYIWHKIKRKDYIALMTDQELSSLDNSELRIFLRQEKITKMCVIYPEADVLADIVENNAGVAGNLSDEIMMISGFRPVSSEQIN